MSHIDLQAEDAERLMFLRLARELGITTTCPKCIAHYLERVKPEWRPEDIFSYTDGLGRSYDWRKTSLLRVAGGYPVTEMPPARARAILGESSVEEPHLPHLPEETLRQPAILVEIRVGLTTRNVFADGNHRAHRLSHSNRPVPVRWIRTRDESKCRTSEADVHTMMVAGQRNGFLVWEMPIMYAVILDMRQRPRFGRIVSPMGAAGAAYLQLAANWADLAVPPELLRVSPQTSPGFFELPLAARPAYDALARAAVFAPTLRISGRDRSIIPVPHGALDKDAPRIPASTLR